MDIMNRIRKLLARSKSDNVHEAGMAAAMAQKLMLEHKVELADLTLAGEKQAPEEVIEASVEGSVVNRAKARRWRISLAAALSSAFNSKVYYQSGTDHIGIIGHKSDVQTVQYLQQYFGLEIQRLCEEGWADMKQTAENEGGLELPRASVWKESFREGAVSAIRERMEREKLKNQVRMGASPETVLARRVMADRLADEARKLAEEVASEATLVASSEAMVLVRQEEKEREQRTQQRWNERFRRNGRSTLRRSSWRAHKHSQDGYGAGKTAGASIPMTAARGGLGGAKARLE